MQAKANTGSNADGLAKANNNNEMSIKPSKAAIGNSTKVRMR